MIQIEHKVRVNATDLHRDVDSLNDLLSTLVTGNEAALMGISYKILGHTANTLDLMVYGEIDPDAWTEQELQEMPCNQKQNL